MSIIKKLIFAIVVIVVLAGILFFYLYKKSEELSMSPTPVPSASVSTIAAVCHLTANTPVTIYSRPDASSGVFGTLAAGESVTITGATATGWYGFDPGVAQAPNVGPFRLRYIQSGGDYTLDSTCDSIPMVAAIPPDTCFMMAQTDIPIYQSASATSSVIETMHAGDYVPAVSKTSSGNTYFLKVDTTHDTTLAAVGSGYIDSSNVNYNGPTCDALPIAP